MLIICTGIRGWISSSTLIYSKGRPEITWWGWSPQKQGYRQGRDVKCIFALVFNADDGLWGPHCPELECHDCEKDKLPVKPALVWDLLLQLDPCKCMGPDEIHPRILGLFPNHFLSAAGWVPNHNGHSRAWNPTWGERALYPAIVRGIAMCFIC